MATATEGVVTTELATAITEGVTTPVTGVTTAATTGLTIAMGVMVTMGIAGTTEVTGIITEARATTGGLGTAIAGRWWWFRPRRPHRSLGKPVCIGAILALTAC